MECKGEIKFARSSCSRPLRGVLNLISYKILRDTSGLCRVNLSAGPKDGVQPHSRDLPALTQLSLGFHLDLVHERALQ